MDLPNCFISYVHILDRVATALDHAPLDTPNSTRVIPSMPVYGTGYTLRWDICLVYGAFVETHLEKSQLFK